MNIKEGEEKGMWEIITKQTKKIGFVCVNKNAMLISLKLIYLKRLHYSVNRSLHAIQKPEFFWSISST